MHDETSPANSPDRPPSVPADDGSDQSLSKDAAVPPSDHPKGAAELSPHLATPAEQPSGDENLPAAHFGLQFRDFVPQQLSNFGLFKVAEYETFEAAVMAANYWLMESPVELIQLETVVLPNIWSKYEEGTTDGSLGTSNAATSHWHQFLRVWYRVCPPVSDDE